MIIKISRQLFSLKIISRTSPAVIWSLNLPNIYSLHHHHLIAPPIKSQQLSLSGYHQFIIQIPPTYSNRHQFYNIDVAVEASGTCEYTTDNDLLNFLIQWSNTKLSLWKHFMKCWKDWNPSWGTLTRREHQKWQKKFPWTLLVANSLSTECQGQLEKILQIIHQNDGHDWEF